MSNELTQIEKVMNQNAELYSNIKGLEQAVADQKPELIALYMSKVIGAFNKVDKDFVADCVTLRQAILDKVYG